MTSPVDMPNKKMKRSQCLKQFLMTEEKYVSSSHRFLYTLCNYTGKILVQMSV